MNVIRRNVTEKDESNTVRMNECYIIMFSRLVVVLLPGSVGRRSALAPLRACANRVGRELEFITSSLRMDLRKFEVRKFPAQIGDDEKPRSVYNPCHSARESAPRVTFREPARSRK
jgi:hypothetical protein